MCGSEERALLCVLEKAVVRSFAYSHVHLFARYKARKTMQYFNRVMCVHVCFVLRQIFFFVALSTVILIAACLWYIFTNC